MSSAVHPFSIETLYPGAWLLCGEVGGRPLQLPLLQGSEGVLLLDTGCASHVESLIVPALRELKIEPQQLRWIITSHCDVDHQGGNAGMKRLAPQAVLACGDADRLTAVSPEGLMRHRYDAYASDHEISYEGETREWLIREAGAEQPFDLTLRGGERIFLGADFELEVLHLPGHSAGRLGIYHASRNTLFAADALHGALYRAVDGTPALCPTYLHVRSYLDTAGKVQALPLEIYAGCHWPVLRGRSSILDFCEESSAFVSRAEAAILEALASGPMTLRALCEQCGPLLGSWPAAAHLELVYAFAGHLEDLLSRGLIASIPDSTPRQYQLTR